MKAATAEHLASIFGTEKDRVNCPFYFKIGECRHGDRCSRLHTRPSIGPTLLLSNMYQRPDMITPGIDANGQPIDPLQNPGAISSKYGDIESLNVCDNLADHMVVILTYNSERKNKLPMHFGAWHSIIVEFSPVTDFRETTCRQYEENNCNRGGYCNFMHLKRISRELRRQLFGRYWGRRSRSRSRSRSPIRHRSHEDHGWRSPARRRDRSPVSEGSEERRASIEQWNRERAQRNNANRVYSESLNKDNMEDDKGYERVGDHCAYEGQQQQRPRDGVYGY
ncbi:hypothetical protein CDL15_Pgr026802 [Punica granatum]|uniref:C3H1-type domain-containing protein n=1 Tax=Punica granatum TaxID=22663 RepID=A0A218WMI3_PUNGR|nr:hypothetical protein CDL15_Pgr026802 [Punica granatum]